ncbi:hypothetical protein LTR95_009267, partial [Oleoguttula sp. CCFEE 5521]
MKHWYLSIRDHICRCACLYRNVRLVLIGIVAGLLAQHPPEAATKLVLLLLNGKLAEVTDDVLHLGVVNIAVLAAEIVE